MRDVDDRQSEAVSGSREHDGAAISGWEMGLHDRFQIRRAATASRDERTINRRVLLLVTPSRLNKRLLDRPW
jgi:hypothetical protein